MSGLWGAPLTGPCPQKDLFAPVLNLSLAPYAYYINYIHADLSLLSRADHRDWWMYFLSMVFHSWIKSSKTELALFSFYFIFFFFGLSPFGRSYDHLDEIIT